MLFLASLSFKNFLPHDITGEISLNFGRRSVHHRRGGETSLMRIDIAK
jgi:hypothetical protein